MSSLIGCESCGGFVVVRASVCPHCSASLSRSRVGRLGKKVALIATGGAVAMTLMACYGGPPEGFGARGGTTAGSASGSASSSPSATPSSTAK